MNYDGDDFILSVYGNNICNTYMVINEME